MSQVDWSKAPEGTTGAMVAHFDHDPEGFGYVEFLSRDDRRDIYREGPDAWVYHERPSAWTGEGLPPVGVRCEAAIPHTSGPDNERSFIWIEGSVIAYYEIKGKTYAWFAEDDGFYPPNVLEFRPIRTPEQIAAEERNKAVAEMMTHVVNATPHDCELLYRAGYRKVTP